MNIVISNNIKVSNCPAPIRAKITKACSMKNPEYIRRRTRKQSTWGVDATLKFYMNMPNGDLVLPRGFLPELQEIAPEQCACADNVQTYGDRVYFGGWNRHYKLYNFQREAVESFLTNDGNGVIIAPAGSGKTNMALRAMYELGVPTLWITHTKDLMYQTKARAEKLISGVGDVGILGDGKKKLGNKRLIIAMVQTLRKNLELVELLSKFVGLVIIDEAHHVPSYTFLEVVNKFPARHMLGVTATPSRKDQLERLMYLGIGAEVARIDRQQLYDEGFLIKPEVRFVYTDFQQKTDAVNVDAGGEDMNYNSLMSDLLQDEDRVETLANSIFLAYRRYGSSIVISESVRYSYKLAERVISKFWDKYGAYGVPNIAVVHSPLSQYTWHACKTLRDAKYAVQSGRALDYRKKGKSYEIKVQQYTDMEMEMWQCTNKQRLDIVERLGRRDIDILFATQIAREGLDAPYLCVGHMATPKRGDTASNRDDGAAVEQEIGRIMRPDPQNPEKIAIWYDYVDDKVGVFKSQYYSRRRALTRLGCDLPKKRKRPDDLDKLASLLNDIKF